MLLFKTDSFTFEEFSMNMDYNVLDSNLEYKTILALNEFQSNIKFNKFNVLLLNYMLRRARLSNVIKSV